MRRWEERKKRKEGPDHHQSESDDDGEGSDNSARHDADEVMGAKEWRIIERIKVE